MYKPFLIPLALVLLIGFLPWDASAQNNQRQQGKQRFQGKNNQTNQAGRNFQKGLGNQNKKGKGKSGQSNNRQAANGSLSVAEQNGLRVLREEEKLARDVYLALHQKWGDQVFRNISQAESQHMNAVANLLSRYSVPDPIVNNSPGVFPSVRFRNLYTTLVQSGSSSLVDALKVGLKIEEMDIADLRISIRQTNNNDIKQVLGRLEQGSQNHLRAFAGRLKSVGGTYVATHISQNEFNQIANSAGPGQGNQGAGQGKGAGQGNGAGQGKRGGNKQNGKRTKGGKGKR